MAQAWWDSGASWHTDFPALITPAGELIALGAPDTSEEITESLRDLNKLADIIVYFMNQPFTPNVCFTAAQYLTSIYLKTAPQPTLLQSYELATSDLALPPSIPGGVSPKKLLDMGRNYAGAIDQAAYIWHESKESGSLKGLARSLRTASHAVYGYHAVLNTLLIVAAKMPMCASAYVDAKDGRVGPAMLQAFFIGPDGEADPETLLFAPAADTFVSPVDAIMSSVLSALARDPVSTFFPDGAAMWNLTSGINASFRKRNAVPKMVRSFRPKGPKGPKGPYRTKSSEIGDSDEDYDSTDTGVSSLLDD